MALNVISPPYTVSSIKKTPYSKEIIPGSISDKETDKIPAEIIPGVSDIMPDMEEIKMEAPSEEIKMPSGDIIPEEIITSQELTPPQEVITPQGITPSQVIEF